MTHKSRGNNGRGRRIRIRDRRRNDNRTKNEEEGDTLNVDIMEAIYCMVDDRALNICNVH